MSHQQSRVAHDFDNQQSTLNKLTGSARPLCLLFSLFLLSCRSIVFFKEIFIL